MEPLKNQTGYNRASTSIFAQSDDTIQQSDSSLASENTTVNRKPWHYYKQGECPVCRERDDCRQNLLTGNFHCRSVKPIDSSFGMVSVDGQGFYIWSNGTPGNPNLNFSASNKVAAAPKAVNFYPASPEERHKQITALINQFPLLNDHQQHLIDRGMSEEEIKKGGYFSLHRDYPYVQNIDPQFPGIKDERLMAVRGIGCPVVDVNGFYVGLQVRPDDGGYRWVSSASQGGYSLHLPNGEMPITVRRGHKKQGAFAEGVLKPDVTANIWGFTTIGAAGGNFSREITLETIRHLVEKEGYSKTFYLMPDAGSKSNEQVMGNYRKLKALVKEAGCELKVIWWGDRKSVV